MSDFVVKPVVENTIALVLNKWLNFISQAQQAAEVEVGEDLKEHFNVEKLKSIIGNDEEVISEMLLLAKDELIKSSVSLQKQFEAQKYATTKSNRP